MYELILFLAGGFTFLVLFNPVAREKAKDLIKTMFYKNKEVEPFPPPIFPPPPQAWREPDPITQKPN